MAISTRWSASPVTRPAHSPSIVARPSSSRPSSRKKSIAPPRSSTTIPMLSNRLSAMALVLRLAGAALGDVPEDAGRVDHIGDAQAPGLHRGGDRRPHVEPRRQVQLLYVRPP